MFTHVNVFDMIAKDIVNIVHETIQSPHMMEVSQML